jgi:tetratricopeptide (TPR) repeat protein
MNYRARYILGLVLSIAQRPEEAIPELRAALAINDPTVEGYERANAQYQLGQALRKAGRMEEAQQELKTAQELKVQLLEGDRSYLATAPLETIERATSTPVEKPKEAGLELIEAPLESIEKEQLKSAQPVFARLAATAYNGLALLYTAKSDLPKAAAQFRLASQWDDSIPDVYYNLGLAYFRQQKLADATQVLEQALAKDPGKLETRRLLGVARFMGKDYAGAADLLASIVGDAPEKDPQTAYSLALAEVQVNRVDEALVIVDRLAAVAPRMAELHALKGQILAQRGECGPAIQSFDTALALKPGLPEVSYFAGMAYLRQSEFERALECFSRELKRDPDHIQSKFHIAFIAITKNEKDAAVPMLEEVVRVNPGHAEALYELGKIQLEKGNLAPAVANLETAASLEPQKFFIFYQLYRAYAAVGRTEDADRALKRYQALKGR